MTFDQSIVHISNMVWGPPVQTLLIVTGILLCCKTRLINVRGIFQGFRLMANPPKKGKGLVTPFQTLMTALAATIGVGNIVGVATAIYSGGPGAIFWMWIMGIIGMATKYSEAFLAIKYRFVEKNGETWGGPMAYIELGMGKRWKWLAMCFAAFTVLASFGIGDSVQSHSTADALQQTFHVAPWISGLVAAVLTAMVIFGGIKRIASFSCRLVPVMGVFYILCCLYIISQHTDVLGASIQTIVHDAFNWHSAGGGMLGFLNMQAMRYGIARGIFSNEAGLGSAPITHAAAKVEHPHHQGLVAMLGTFFDTVIVCALTGITLVCTGAADHHVNGYGMTAIAFNSTLPHWGTAALSVSVAVFAFSTLIGWSYHMESAARYCMGKRSIPWMRGIWVIVAFMGTTMHLDTVWHMSDLFNGLMIIPNLIAMLALIKVIDAREPA